MKNKILIYEYKLRQSFIAHKYSNRNLEVLLSSKLHFHTHVNCKLLGLVRTFCSLEYC
jgi:hypothetical protein